MAQNEFHQKDYIALNVGIDSFQVAIKFGKLLEVGALNDS